MAEKPFNLQSYYRTLVKVFNGGTPVVRQRIASKMQAPGDPHTPVGTARAFMKDANSMYSNMMSSYRTI